MPYLILGLATGTGAPPPAGTVRMPSWQDDNGDPFFGSAIDIIDDCVNSVYQGGAVGIRFGSDGSLLAINDNTTEFRDGPWNNKTCQQDFGWFSNQQAGVGAFYEIRVTLTSGSIDSGYSDDLNTWLSLSTNRQWGHPTVQQGFYAQAEFRLASDQSVVLAASNATRFGADAAPP